MRESASPSTTMKAVVCTAYGPPEVLRLADVDRPRPRPHEVRIRVEATCVTASDCLVRALKFRSGFRLLARLILGFNAPRRGILGTVLAGEVESVGRDVRAFQPGERVFGLSRWAFGAYAEYVCWSATGLLARRPANLSAEACAAIPYGGLLALYFLRRAGVQAGQRVLIYGASGAIGTSAVQLARHFGARVTGVCSGANRALVESLGAETVLDYTREDFTAGGPIYDVILDAVGKRKSLPAFSRAARALTPTGRAFSVDDRSPSLHASDLDYLRGLAEAGALKPVVDRTYALDQMVEAHRYVDQGHKRGNVVVTMSTAR